MAVRRRRRLRRPPRPPSHRSARSTPCLVGRWVEKQETDTVTYNGLPVTLTGGNGEVLVFSRSGVETVDYAHAKPLTGPYGDGIYEIRDSGTAVYHDGTQSGDLIFDSSDYGACANRSRWTAEASPPVPPARRRPSNCILYNGSARQTSEVFSGTYAAAKPGQQGDGRPLESFVPRSNWPACGNRSCMLVRQRDSVCLLAQGARATPNGGQGRGPRWTRTSVFSDRFAIKIANLLRQVVPGHQERRQFGADVLGRSQAPSRSTAFLHPALMLEHGQLLNSSSVNWRTDRRGHRRPLARHRSQFGLHVGCLISVDRRSVSDNQSHATREGSSVETSPFSSCRRT